jgi:two-component system sensor histidine kinase KdpD
MTKLTHFSKLAFASSSEIESAVQELRAARHEFLTTGQASPSPYLRPVIQDSWQRCIARVNPGQRQVPLAVADESGLRDLRLANEPLLRAAGPILERLTSFFDGSGYILGLADAHGRLLQVVGDDAPRRRLQFIGLAPGGDWAESAAGTNGIGTALAVGHAVQVLGPEHFCDGWQDIVCITALIHHPQTNAVIGALDISGDYHLVRPFFTGFLAASALEIKQALRAAPGPRNAHPALTATRYRPARRGAAVERLPAALATSENMAGGADDFRIRLDIERRRARDAERLALAAGCISASLDLQATLNQVAEQAAHLLGLDDAAACLVDEAGRVTALRGWSREPVAQPGMLQSLEAVLYDSDVVTLARETGEPVVVDDVRAWAAARGAQPPGPQPPGSFALLPMMSAPDGVIGLILAPRPGPYAWSADDLRLGLALTVQAAAAVENARLFERLQHHHRHVQALNTVNQLLSTFLDPAQHLDQIIERIVVVMGLDAGLVLLGDQLPADPARTAVYGLPAHLVTERGGEAWLALREMMTRAAATGEPMLICRQEHGGAEAAPSSGFCDSMVAPLAVGGDYLGLLWVGSIRHRGLSEANLPLFASLGQQLGLALKNAQLLREAGEMEALREADRLKGRFLMTVSHDLRSPLTAIRTSVESLLDQRRARAARGRGQLLNNIADQARRLGRLVDQLLDLSRIEAGALTLDRDWTELPALLTDTAARFEALHGACRVNVHLAPDLPLSYIDPDRLVQVLWNLLENAHKYGPPGACISVSAERADHEVHISVADHGPGIPASEREKVFQYFYRLEEAVRRQVPGSGLGLAICQGIVEAHGGRIWVEGRPGGGSVFRFVLPAGELEGRAGEPPL